MHQACKLGHDIDTSPPSQHGTRSQWCKLCAHSCMAHTLCAAVGVVVASHPPCGNVLGVGLFGVDATARPKVCQLEAIIHDEDVLGLDVAVEDAVPAVPHDNNINSPRMSDCDDIRG